MIDADTTVDRLAVAVAWRKIIWREPAQNEDERLDRLKDVCRRLHDGDERKGDDLMTQALWTP